MAGSAAAARTDGSQYYSFMNWQPGNVISWRVVSQVLESKAEGFSRGDFVVGTTPWRELATVRADEVQKVPEGVSPSASLSAVGMTARTAYLGVKFIGEPVVGDVAFVSGAAGASPDSAEGPSPVSAQMWNGWAQSGVNCWALAHRQTTHGTGLHNRTPTCTARGMWCMALHARQAQPASQLARR
jgi:hypothetical protein